MKGQRPIELGEHLSFPTVQEALLCALRMHEKLMQQPTFSQNPATALKYLLADLNMIRDGIAARAVPDEYAEPEPVVRVVPVRSIADATWHAATTKLDVVR